MDFNLQPFLMGIAGGALTGAGTYLTTAKKAGEPFNWNKFSTSLVSGGIGGAGISGLFHLDNSATALIASGLGGAVIDWVQTQLDKLANPGGKK